MKTPFSDLSIVLFCRGQNTYLGRENLTRSVADDNRHFRAPPVWLGWLQLLSILNGEERESPSSQIKISSADWLPVKFPRNANVLWIWCRLSRSPRGSDWWVRVPFTAFLLLWESASLQLFSLKSPNTDIESADRGWLPKMKCCNSNLTFYREEDWQSKHVDLETSFLITFDCERAYSFALPQKNSEKVNLLKVKLVSKMWTDIIKLLNY
jgi:hypothetical protein